LERAAAGEFSEELALALAASVVARDDLQLALAVLRGGEHQHARAIELAALVLKAAQLAAEAGRRAQGGEG